MKRISDPIQTTELCYYGCGQEANFINGSKNLMCCKSSNSCPENRNKNRAGVKNSGRDYINTYNNLPQETKDKMSWTRGLTKETDARVGRPKRIGIRWGSSLTGHTDETKKKLSVLRTNWLKVPENRKNLGRHKKSWMEQTFEIYLTENNIEGYESEIHFWNDELRKNYYVDFVFEDKKLIIELDGNQHRNTVEQDTIRDNWFKTKSYTVIRLTHEEFKKRYFSGQGFLDILGR